LFHFIIITKMFRPKHKPSLIFLLPCTYIVWLTQRFIYGCLIKILFLHLIIFQFSMYSFWNNIVKKCSRSKIMLTTSIIYSKYFNLDSLFLKQMIFLKIHLSNCFFTILRMNIKIEIEIDCMQTSRILWSLVYLRIFTIVHINITRF